MVLNSFFILPCHVFVLMQDTFFYSLVYDPTQKTLLADKGEIRVGSRYQAEVPPMLTKRKNMTYFLCVSRHITALLIVIACLRKST